MKYAYQLFTGIDRNVFSPSRVEQGSGAAAGDCDVSCLIAVNPCQGPAYPEVRGERLSRPAQRTEDVTRRGVDRNRSHEMHENVTIRETFEEPAHFGFERAVLQRRWQGQLESCQQYLMRSLVGGNSGQSRTQCVLVTGTRQVVEGKRRRFLAAAQDLQKL
jgi:hypothetical protein